MWPWIWCMLQALICLLCLWNIFLSWTSLHDTISRTNESSAATSLNNMTFLSQESAVLLSTSIPYVECGASAVTFVISTCFLSMIKLFWEWDAFYLNNNVQIIAGSRNGRPFYKVKGAVFCGSTDVATRWPWYVPAEIWELNILASNRFHKMFEGWTSISFAWRIPLSRGWRFSMTSSHPFC